MKCWIYVDFSPHVSEFICCFSYISVSFMNYWLNLSRFKPKCVNLCHVTIDVILVKVFQTLRSSVARLQAQNVKKNPLISLWFLLSVFLDGKQSVIKVHACVCAGDSSLLLSPWSHICRAFPPLQSLLSCTICTVWLDIVSVLKMLPVIYH